MEKIKLKVIEEIEKSKKQQIEFLQRLVQTHSVNPHMDDPTKSSPYDPIELELAELIFKKLKELGLEPKFESVSPSRPNVVCQFGKGKKTLIFNGHMDTVPPAQGYDFNPFLGFIKNGKLYGAGALDMKASLCCYIFMAKALSKFEKELKGKICLQFVIDEEPMAASHFGTRYLLEKGYTGDAAIVGEPGAKKITIGNRGGYRFKIEVFGDAVHTGSREWEQKNQGLNAILEMAKVIYALQDFSFPTKEHPVFPKRKNVLTFPVLIKGGKAINMVPDSCLAFGDARILPGITKEFMEKEIRKSLDKLGVNYKLTPIVYVPAVFVKPSELFIQILKKNSKQMLKKEPLTEGSGPWSDMWMFIEKGIPAVNFGCDGKGAHDRNEYVELKSMIDVTKIYALTTLDFLC
ncbi:MAG: M20 family metallopeptidase [Candidatus Pacebacteria bacterium]|nr:M20 family metallopeptidase [Candidatus Paceibacterota bacterium]